MRLDQVMNVEKILPLEEEAIRKLWLKYHYEKPAVVSTLQSKQFTPIATHLSRYPRFIWPLPKDNGYITFFSQYMPAAGPHDHHIFYTPLSLLQEDPNTTTTGMQMHFFADLMDEKDMVLMRGDYEESLLNATEAQFLANQFQLYYGDLQPHKHEFLATFNERPADFNFDALLQDMDIMA